LLPGYGYFIWSEQDCRLIFPLPTAASYAPPVKKRNKTFSQIQKKAIFAKVKNWTGRISLILGKYNDLDNYFGISEIASDGKDLFDVMEPLVMNPAISLYFPHENYFNNAGDYTTDYRAPVDENGTDLPRVHRHLCPEYDVCFTYQTDGRPFDDKEMNLLFNSADVYINLASNEGFGLGSCEAMTVGTPIIVNVTGGLQDQCGFKKDGEFLTPDDYIELGSNHLGTYTEHGEWVFPVFPSNRSLQGSPATPYIWDDRCQPETAAIQLRKLYNMDREERKRLGSLGTEFCKENLMTSQAMGQRFIDSMNGAFDKWKPQPKYYMEAV
jgi:hypothetical protein